MKVQCGNCYWGHPMKGKVLCDTEDLSSRVDEYIRYPIYPVDNSCSEWAAKEGAEMALTFDGAIQRVADLEKALDNAQDEIAGLKSDRDRWKSEAYDWMRRYDISVMQASDGKL